MVCSFNTICSVSVVEPTVAVAVVMDWRNYPTIESTIIQAVPTPPRLLYIFSKIQLDFISLELIKNYHHFLSFGSRSVPIIKI